MENSTPETFTPHKNPNPLNKFIPLIALVLTLPVAVLALKNSPAGSVFARKSSCVPINKVNVNPGKITTYLGATPSGISALAYSSTDLALTSQIRYQWGMSSTNSIGDLKPKQEIALFVPQNVGVGNIWVEAKNSCTLNPVRTSIPVEVTATALPTPTPVPPKPTPTSTPIPTPTRIPTQAPRSITIVTPNGGETLVIGETYRITWSNTPDIDTVFLGWSTGPGSLNWIATSLPNSGFYDWQVNVGNTTNTQFKISITGYDTGVGSSQDQSDNFFTVLKPTPTPSI